MSSDWCAFRYLTWISLENDLKVICGLPDALIIHMNLQQDIALLRVSKKLFRDISHNMKHATRSRTRLVDFGILNTSPLLYYCLIAEQFCLPSFSLFIHTFFLSVYSVNFELIQCIHNSSKFLCCLDCLRRNHAIVQNNQI